MYGICLVLLVKLQYLLPILRWRQACIRLEVAAESSLVRETQLVGNLLNGHLLLVAQQHLGLHHDITADPLSGGDTGMLLDDGSKVLGCKVHQVGIEPYLSALMVVAVYGLVESGEQFFLRRRLVMADAVLATVVL